jgi:chromosome segregation ATPase
MDFSKFELLESKLATILEKRNLAEARAKDLEAALDEANDKLAKARETIESFEGEKSEYKRKIESLEADHADVLARIDGLINKLDI